MTPIHRIKAELPMEEYAGRYVTVKNHKAICPFHEEKTASLRLWSDRFKCFGCGAGGDVITFASQYHQLSVKDTIRMLSHELGIGLTYQKVHPYAAIKQRRLESEAVEWRRVLRWRMVTAPDYETSVPFLDDLDAMTKKEVFDCYMEQRTLEEAAELRESAAKHATPTVQSVLMEFLKWSRV